MMFFVIIGNFDFHQASAGMEAGGLRFGSERLPQLRHHKGPPERSCAASFLGRPQSVTL